MVISGHGFRKPIHARALTFVRMAQCWAVRRGGAERRFELMTAENTTKEQRGKPFTPGASGNPDGRPKGSRNKSTLALEALLDGQAEALTQKAVELALAGDITALRLCLDRI